jgi:hypothetical protein
MKNKIIGIFVCTLLIGTVLPAAAYEIDNTNASLNNDYLEISTELCGINYGEYNVILTKDNALEVKHLIDNIEKNLDEKETVEEAVDVFNIIIEKLYGYGLFGELSFKEVQRLVYNWYEKSISTKFLENRNEENQASDASNFLCLIAGKTDKTLFLSRHTSATTVIMMMIDEFKEKLITLTNYVPIVGWTSLILFSLLIGYFELPVYLISAYGYEFSIINPIAVGHLIYFGDYDDNEITPADGWISTFGINGKKSWNNEIIGQISSLPISVAYKRWYSEINPGVAGFTGIKLSIDDEYFYLGSALRVVIE